jgi:ankyrin repeat protein
MAAYHGQEAVALLPLECEDVDTDSRNIYGHTTLLLAEWYGSEAMVRLLIEFKGVSEESKDRHNRTLLSWAEEK